MRTATVAWLVFLVSSAASADPMACSLAEYRPSVGLTAVSAADTLTITWKGERNQDLRLQFVLTSGMPTIRSMDVRPNSAAPWRNLAANVAPDYRVVSGIRRISNQQLVPLRALGVELTPAIVERFRWDPFWDAPLDLSTQRTGSNPPPAEGVGNSPGLPRKRDEIKRASLVARVTQCDVKTLGARIEVAFPGVQLGVFSGTLQYSIFRGSNLIQQDVLASTNDPWVAYKYDGGLSGFSARSGDRVAWKDIANNWQEYRLGGAINEREVPLSTSSRVVIAERGSAGAIALFPPPHTFFWAREVAINLGYNWYRKDSANTFSLGVRQAEQEHEAENFTANFSLYSARPGTVQRMTCFLYLNAGNAAQTFDAAVAYTHGDRYKALPGYQVMNHHYHMDLGERLARAGSLDATIPDLAALRALGINIVSQIDSVIGGGGGETTPDGATLPGGAPVTAATREAARARAAAAQPAPAAPAAPPAVVFGRGVDPLEVRYNSIEGAKRHSDVNFLVLPSQEYFSSPLGGHTDLLFSHPVFWSPGRAPGQPLVEARQKYGKVYHVGSAEDLMEMARREDVLINMPHPRTKGSTGYPDAIKHLPFFSDAHYEGVGFRWGMGVDLSERRLCEYRCQPLFDDMNNWVADSSTPPKHIMAISEVRHMQPGDDIYSSAPVQYVKLDRLPTPDDTSSVIQALMRGDSFVTSGEVLIPSFAVRGTGAQRAIVADVEYTFPLDFVEIVWGDGVKTDRQVISTTELTPLGSHRFEIPFAAAGRKWVRFAAWDSAGNGAMTQPVRLFTPAR